MILLLSLAFGYGLRRSERKLRLLQSAFASLAPSVTCLPSGVVNWIELTNLFRKSFLCCILTDFIKGGKYALASLYLFGFHLFGADFDCAIVGTSPVPLFEALYRHHSGERVLILEAAAECGGAWKSIDICGIAHADMGCHEISSSIDLNRFLEDYAGCSMISCHTNYYFSNGCFELINNLLKRIRAAGIPC